MQPLLGTYVEVGAHADAPGQAIDAAFLALRQCHDRWSFHDARSELSRLNAAPGCRVPVGAATVRLVRLAAALMRRSGGLFDCTVGGLLVGSGHLPDHGGTSPHPRGTADDIATGPGWVSLRRPVRVTLDGIAKGYAVDLAIGALRRAGATAGWVNAGGDLRVFGDRVLPVHRREADGSTTPLGGLRDAAVATSRARPAGAPADPASPARLVAPGDALAAEGVWTVLARSAWRADALTKVAATAPPHERAARVARLGGHLLTVPIGTAA